MRQLSLVKNQANYENEQAKETYENEQKPIKNFNEFSDSEEQEVKTAQQNDWRADAKKQKNWRIKNANKNWKRTKSKKVKCGIV